MKKYRGIIGVGLLAVLIGIVLSVQISTTAGSDQGGLVPLAKLRDYEVALKQIKDERDDAMEQLVALEERLNSIEKELAAEDEIINGMVSDTEKYKLAAGVLDVIGPGVLITIKDPVISDEYQEDISAITYNYELLLSLVNKLKEAGAEAISINENRIVQTTEISLAASHININGNATAPPYYVKAIGNPTTMENALTIRGGIIENMKKNYNLSVDVVKKNEVTIARYSKVINFKYAKPLENKE